MAKSLAAQQNLIVPEGNKLPAIFDAKPEIKPRAMAPYVVFGHPMSPGWGKFVGSYPDAKEGQQFLVQNEKVTRLDQFRYSLMTAKQYWAEGDQEGVKAVSLTEKPHPFKEVIEAVVLVYLGELLIPATVQFRSVKTGAVLPAVKALEQAASPDWAKLSQAHELTLVCQKPFMRFFAEVQLGNMKTSKSSGMRYLPASCVIKPTTAVEWKILAAHFSGENTTAFYAALNEAADTFERRMAELTSKT